MKPVLALVLGDCTGIGPEQCARVLSDGRLADAARLLVVGDARVLAQGAADAGVSLRTSPCRSPIARLSGPHACHRLGNIDPARMRAGHSAESASSLRDAQDAIRLASRAASTAHVRAAQQMRALNAGAGIPTAPMFAHHHRPPASRRDERVRLHVDVARDSHVSCARRSTISREPHRYALCSPTRLLVAGFAQPRNRGGGVGPARRRDGLPGRERARSSPAVARAPGRASPARAPPRRPVFLRARRGIDASFDGHDQGRSRPS